jgi:hypothetical protein
MLSEKADSPNRVLTMRPHRSLRSDGANRTSAGAIVGPIRNFVKKKIGDVDHQRSEQIDLPRARPY